MEVIADWVALEDKSMSEEEEDDEDGDDGEGGFYLSETEVYELF